MEKAMKTDKPFSPRQFFAGGMAGLRRRLLAALNLLVLLSMVVSPAVAAGPANSIQPEDAEASLPIFFLNQRVENSKYFHWMSDRSMRIDSNRLLHIAYGGDHLYYLYYTGSAWQYELVDAAPGTGKYAALALDRNNRPHIAYYDAIRGALKYARKTGASWEVFTIEAPLQSFGMVEQGFDLDEGFPLTDTPDVRGWRYSLPGSGNPLDQEFVPEIGDLQTGEAYLDFESSGLPEVEAGESSQDEANPEGEAGEQSGDEQTAVEQTASEVEAAADLSLDETSPDAVFASTQVESGFGLYPSIAVNSFGSPSISYYDSLNGNLKYATWSGTGWNIQTLDSAGDVGLFTSLAVDSGDFVHISYYDASNGDLKYIRWTGTAWTAPRVIDNGGDSASTRKFVGLYSSLAVDGSRNPHISYYDQDGGNLKYARSSSGSWTTSVVDSTGDVGLHTSLVMDYQTKAHITYYNATSADLKYAVCGSSSCSTQTIASEGFVGRYSSVVIDGLAIRTSFFDSGTGQLKWAYPSGSIWVIQALDQSADVGLFSSMKLNAAGDPRIAYFDDIRDDLKYASWSSGTWNVSTIDQAGEVGLYTSLALDQTNGFPRISYYDGSNRRLKYAAWTGTAWSIQVVDNGPGVGAFTSLALNSAGLPRIAYCAGPGCFTGKSTDPMELRLALFNGSNWIIKSVETGAVGLYASLALDSGNNVHISYYDAANRQLKYARSLPDGSAWKLQVADSNPKVGLFSSIAVDSSGRPHIAYFDDYLDRLRYATFDGSWKHEVVDSSGPVGGYNSLVLDSAGLPHISYYDFSSRSLKYARRAGSGWQTMNADSSGDVGRYSSLALKGGSTPVISYYDGTSGDLKYAFPSNNVKTVFLPIIRR